jgi:DNA-binding CsgD family transcriptional regulator
VSRARRADDKRAGALGLVRAAYENLEAPPSTWANAIASAAAPELDQGLGVMALLCAAPSYRPHTLGAVGAAAEFIPALLHNHAEVEHESPHMLARIFSGPPRLVSARQNSRTSVGVELDAQPGFSHAQSVGMYDGLLMIAACPSGLTFALLAPSAKAVDAPASSEKWARAAAHLLGIGRLRLRRAAATQPETAGAIFDSDGRLQHAPDPEAPVQRLRAACIAAERARGSGADDSALEPWKALVSGRYSLVDWFDTDGRRFLLATENAPRSQEIAGLSPRETQVAAYLALGHPFKYIAYELGLSVSSVARDAARAVQKLGLRDRVELVQVLGTIVRPREE